MVEATVSEGSIGDLAARLRGRIIRPGDGDYDDARRVWNTMIDRRPALIVRPTVAADVVAAVNFARDNALIVSLRSGGHNVAGNAVCDGGLVIDFSEMKAISVDPQAKTATAEPGATPPTLGLSPLCTPHGQGRHYYAMANAQQYRTLVRVTAAGEALLRTARRRLDPQSAVQYHRARDGQGRRQ